MSSYGRLTLTILTLASGTICIFNWGKLSGLEYGYFYGVFESPPNEFNASGPNHFQSINIWYFFIVSCLVVYLVGFLFTRWRISIIFRVAVLSISLFPLLEMLLYKTEHYGLDLPYYHYPGLKASYFLDLACVGMFVVMMVMEIMAFRSSRPDLAMTNG